MANACLGREMNNPGQLRVAVENGTSCYPVAEVDLMKGEAVAPLELGQEGAFQLWVVIGVQIVEADDDLAAVEQTPGDTESDESGGAGDENHASLHRAASIVKSAVK